ncbi:MAG: cytochrome C oxidase subunit IV family protein, partial [Burkholderiales bacterium]|nr:cytochrome C oxidase subunit IV family protein [Burkholderiales bacterium]
QAARLGAVPALAVLALALAKAQIVADQFMGLRRVHALWRFLMLLYLSGVGALVAYAFISR